MKLSFSFYIKHHNSVLGEKFMKIGRTGVTFDRDRLEPWTNIRNGHFSAKDTSLVTFGYAIFDSDIGKKDKIYEFFEDTKEGVEISIR